MANLPSYQANIKILTHKPMYMSIIIQDPNQNNNSNYSPQRFFSLMTELKKKQSTIINDNNNNNKVERLYWHCDFENLKTKLAQGRKLFEKKKSRCQPKKKKKLNLNFVCKKSYRVVFSLQKRGLFFLNKNAKQLETVIKSNRPVLTMVVQEVISILVP